MIKTITLTDEELALLHEHLTLDSEIEEITFIQSQILTLCKIIGNIAKASCE